VKSPGSSGVLDRLEDTRLDLSAEDESVLDHPCLEVRAWGLTDTGKVRPVNEDRFTIAEFPRPGPDEAGRTASSRIRLFAVADGMGGHAGGQRASALALETLQSYLRDIFHNGRDLRAVSGDRVVAGLQAAVAVADAEVHGQARQHPELHGMGCTLTAACLCQRELVIAQVGDSRCYLIRNGVLKRLTSDQTMVAELVRAGVLKPEEAARHPWRHVITHAIGGTEAGARPELQRLAVAPGDLILLCSDGLTDMLSDDELLAEAQDEASPDRLCQRLVNRANERGGRDNITVVVARLAEPVA
jgi:PPM family protein phosphatase